MAARKEDLTHSLTNPIFNSSYHQKILSYTFCYSLTFFFLFSSSPQAWPRCRLRTAGPDLLSTEDSLLEQKTIIKLFFQMNNFFCFVSGFNIQHFSHFRDFFSL